jgi:hypothetical protein
MLDFIVNRKVIQIPMIGLESGKVLGTLTFEKASID